MKWLTLTLIPLMLIGCSGQNTVTPTDDHPSLHSSPKPVSVSNGSGVPQRNPETIPEDDITPSTNAAVTPQDLPFEINGLRFVQELSANSLGCIGPIVGATESEIADSPLNFETEYLPQGYTLGWSAFESCDGRLSGVSKVYTSQEGRTISVTRWTMVEYLLSDSITPLPIEVDGKPGVRLGRTILLRESFGQTWISGLSYEDSVLIAQGLRPASE